MGKGTNNTLESLKFLSSQSSDPFDSIATSETKRVEQRLGKQRLVEESESSKSVLDRLEKKLSKMGSIGNDDFDDIIDVVDEYDEDIELRNSIIESGRKYARDFAASESSSELSKAFASQEVMLKDMIKLIDNDIIEIGKDIDQMRFNRTRSPKSLADLATAKKEYYNTKLGLIKEINAIKKAQFDIKAKQDKAGASGEDPTMASNAVIQSIFGMGQDSFFSDGGREMASMSDDDSDYYDDTVEQSDEAENNHYTAKQAMAHSAVNDMSIDDESDGAKFLKYEGRGVSLVLEEDLEGSYKVYAEDRDGNRVDDYPLPDDIDELTFDKNLKAGTAVDQLQNHYKYRYNGSNYGEG